MTRPRPKSTEPDANQFSDAACATCGKSIGLLWADFDGARCWFCAMSRPRPAPRTTPLRKPDDEVWM